MLFKLIPKKIVSQNIIDFIRFHYNKDFGKLKDVIKVDIKKGLFLKIKKGSRVGRKELLRLLKKNHERISQDKIRKIKTLWYRNEIKILKTIKNITGIKISIKKITCYLDPYTKLGFYGKNHISLSTNIKLKDVLFVIAHELFHIFYWRKIKKLSLKMNKEKEWILSEITVYLLQKQPEMKRFWPKSKIYLYPELKKVYKLIKRNWKPNEFNNFLIKSYYSLK
ncbi:MAG: hypothetical protein KJ767_00925 [Nanoarchaeota archaeon]|nr:hypothetical protein [Nanoarchaeota archaeon]